MEVRGTARKGKRTKELVLRLQPGDIAVIDHRDIDEVAAEGLIARRVRAVVNAAPSISGRYPNRGPLLLVEAGIYLVDGIGSDGYERIAEGEPLHIRDGALYQRGRRIAEGRVCRRAEIRRALEEARRNLEHEIDDFVENTLEYAYRERGLFGQIEIPPLPVSFRDRIVLVVVRGQSYRDDLRALHSYISENRPILVGVDGGADAILESGYRPHLIVGDMDSVTDRALTSGAALLVHAYPSGEAPGLERIRRLGLDAAVIRAPGTSEDVALWVAYEGGAQLIIAVGTHSNIVDFLEKGRKGMASTFLVRLKVGSILVDAKGVSHLYRGRPSRRYGVQILVAALVPFLLVLTLSDTVRQWFTLFGLRLRLMLGF